MGVASANRSKFNQSLLASLERRVDSGDFQRESYIYDAQSHLAIRIRPGQKFLDCAFCIYERIRAAGDSKSRQYKRVIMKVGEARAGNFVMSDLRKRADELYLAIQNGDDPVDLDKDIAQQRLNALRMKEASRPTLHMILGTPVDVPGQHLPDGFVAERRPSAAYLSDIHKTCIRLLDGVMDTPLHAVTAEHIKDIYLQREKQGRTQLHNGLRILRSVWNWARDKYDDSGLYDRNPVTRAMKLMGININKTNRRKVRLDDCQIEPYLKAVVKLQEHDHPSGFRNGRDALLFMLFSGVRRMGALSIRKDRLDLARKTFTIIKKGGGEVELPLNSVTRKIVESRLHYLPNDVEYLFPSFKGGHCRDTCQARRTVKSLSGVYMTNHDLRRTYKSIGAELGINQILVDELLCHEREGVDAHYIHPSMDALRNASEQIAQYLLEKAGATIDSQMLATQW